jgi:hypothetical protein
MPQSANGHVSAVKADGGDHAIELATRVRLAEERTLDYWLEAVMSSTNGSMTVKALQTSVSWRVTKPLRAARLVQTKLREVGVRRTAGMVRVRLAQIRQARKRG